MDEEKTCAWCNKDMAMAGFGILLGLVLIAMSVDIVRRSRMSNVEVETDAGFDD